MLKCVEATEAEDSLNGWGVAPGYYEELAILYRKEKRYADEVARIANALTPDGLGDDSLYGQEVTAPPEWTQARMVAPQTQGSLACRCRFRQLEHLY